jgi:hypothetical protein
MTASRIAEAAEVYNLLAPYGVSLLEVGANVSEKLRPTKVIPGRRAKALRNLHKASAEVDASDSTSAPNRRAPLSRSNPRAKFCWLTHGRADANLGSARSERDNVSIDPLIDGLAFPEPGKPWYALVAGRVKEHGPQDTVFFEGPSNTGNLGKKAFGQSTTSNLAGRGWNTCQQI